MPKQETPNGFVTHRNHNYQIFLRDQFAMAALTSMLATPQKIQDGDFETAARLSYAFADAMLKAREL